MRLFFLFLGVLLLVTAGCANNRPQSDIAPSRLAASDPNAGWSVPPGQKHVTDPTPGTQAQADKAAQDEAALAAADKARRDEIAQRERAELAARQEQRREQPAVAPLVPAFPERAKPVAIGDLRTVHFAFDEYDLNAESRALLEANANWLKANPEVLVQVGGHADERGTPEYNLALGEKRARRVREFLIEHGVPPENMVTASYGEEKPLNEGHDEQSWSVNRRAEFNRVDGRRISAN